MGGNLVDNGQVAAGFASGALHNDPQERLSYLDVRRFGQLLRDTWPKALDRAGQYFQRADTAGPWSTNPGTNTHPITAAGTNSSHVACRRSYTVYMTDGFWNDTGFSITSYDTSNSSVISGT